MQITISIIFLAVAIFIVVKIVRRNNRIKKIRQKRLNLSQILRAKLEKSEKFRRIKEQAYEMQIANECEKFGWKVQIIRKDGINLIAIKDEKIRLIRCINQDEKIDIIAVNSFFRDCANFEQKNVQIIGGLKVIRNLFSNSSANDEAKEYLDTRHDDCTFIHLQADEINIE